jgi:hypothetical protein
VGIEGVGDVEVVGNEGSEPVFGGVWVIGCLSANRNICSSVMAVSGFLMEIWL